jgi:hypothetical protein
MEGSPLPDWMKPSNAKAIVLPDQARWRGRPVDIAIPVGKRIPQRTINWLQQFAQQHNRMLLYAEQISEAGVFTNRQNVFAYGPPDFQSEVTTRVSNGEFTLAALTNLSS